MAYILRPHRVSKKRFPWQTPGKVLFAVYTAGDCAVPGIVVTPVVPRYKIHAFEYLRAFVERVTDYCQACSEATAGLPIDDTMFVQILL